MRLKNFSLKAHCHTCSQLIFHKPFLANMNLIKDMAYLEALLYDQFPPLKACPKCDSEKVVKSYSCITHAKLNPPPADIFKAEIERAQNQIAATYDFDNNMSAEERCAVREAFQRQLDQLLTKNNISR